MKTRLFLLGCALAGLFAACTSESTTHDATKLPESARNLISRNFTSAISLVEEEKSMGSVKEYEVTLTDGSEITFTGSGDWKSVDTPAGIAVPSGLVPTAIQSYVDTKHQGAFIDGIEKNKKGYEVELSNNIEIQFDMAGNFVSYLK